MGSVTLLDDATRPKAPKIEGVTADQRRLGKRLALFHRYHLQQLQEVAHVMQRVEDGQEALARLSGAISEMQMAANYRNFGNLCGHECQILTFHHSAEDQYIFPRLHRNGSDGLRKVIERLSEEHLAVHQAIEELEAGATGVMQNPCAETFAPLKAAFLRLDKLVRSHFGYEETELEEALGYFGVEI